MTQCPNSTFADQATMLHPQLVSYEEVVENTIKLSGVSTERFEEIDKQPPSKFLVKVSEEGMDLMLPAIAAKWNSSIEYPRQRLELSKIIYDPGNEYGDSSAFSSSVAGCAVLVCRGQCSLADKALNAAEAGALMVFVHNNDPGLLEGAMSAGDRTPSIPGFMISYEVGFQLRTALQAGRSALIQSVDLHPSTFFERLGGEKPIRSLVARFYKLAFSDSEAWFREIFADREEATAARNLADFLIQRWGGPTYFSERKGHAQLIARHMSFRMKPGSAERWLHHMEAAIAKMSVWDEETISLLKDYFRYQAHFLAYSYAAAYATSQSEAAAASCCEGGCSKQDTGSNRQRLAINLATQYMGGTRFRQRLEGFRPLLMPGLALIGLGLGLLSWNAMIHRRMRSLRTY